MTDQPEGGFRVSNTQAGQPGAGEHGSVEQPSTGASANWVPREEFDEVVNQLRGLQSKQDKTARLTENQITEIDGQLNRMAELLEAGFTAPQAKQQLLLDKMVKDYYGDPQAAVPSPRVQPQASGQTGETFDVQEVVQALGYEMSDPIVAKAMFNSKGDEQEFTRRLIQETARRRNQQQQPNQAAAPPAQQGGRISPDEEAALRAEYEKQKLNIRPGDVRAITNLQRIFIEKGLNLRR